MFNRLFRITKSRKIFRVTTTIYERKYSRRELKRFLKGFDKSYKEVLIDIERNGYSLFLLVIPKE